MSGYRLTRIRRNALPDAVNNMLAGAKVGDTLSLTVYGEPSDVVITELDNEWFEGRHTPRPVTARPVGGDTREALREELADAFLRHWRTVTSSCECGELCLGQSYPRHLADAVLGLPTVRAALDAQETVRRVEELHRPIDPEGYPAEGGDVAYCDNDGFVWPCWTHRVLNGESS